MRLNGYLFLTGIALYAPLSATALAQEAADLLLTNGYVYTVNEGQPEAEAVAIRGNEIVFVGSADYAADYVGDSTDVIDLDGKMVLPGYVSAHDRRVCLVDAGRGSKRCQEQGGDARLDPRIRGRQPGSADHIGPGL